MVLSVLVHFFFHAEVLLRFFHSEVFTEQEVGVCIQSRGRIVCIPPGGLLNIKILYLKSTLCGYSQLPCKCFLLYTPSILRVTLLSTCLGDPVDIALLWFPLHLDELSGSCTLTFCLCVSSSLVPFEKLNTFH